MEVTPRIIRKFVKDHKLPIQVYDEKYFYDLLRFYDKYYMTMAKWEEFKLLVDSIYPADIYDTIVHSSQDVIAEVKETREWEYLSKRSEKHLTPSYPEHWADKKIYIPENAGKFFIELDWKNANFQALKAMMGGTVAGHETYESLILSTISNRRLATHFIWSKPLRQVIFGNLNPKAQRNYQKKTTVNIALELQPQFQNMIYSLTPDCITFELPDVYSFGEANSILDSLEITIDDAGVDLHKRVYLLENIPHHKYDFMRQEYFDGSKKFRNVHSYFLPQVIANVEGYNKLEKFMMAFYMEGEIAMFVEPLFQGMYL